MKQRWLRYGWMMALGVAHAQTFAAWASGGLQILILSLAWALFAVARPEDKPVRQMFVFALAWFCAGLYWLHFSMHDIGGLPTVLSMLAIVVLCAYLAGFYALAAWLWRRFFTGQKLSDYLIAMPALWLAAELARAYAFGGFPWLATGYAQVDNFVFKGWFAVVGVYGVGVIAAMVSGVLAWLWVGLRQRSLAYQTRQSVVSILVLLTLVVLGWVLQGIHWGQAVGAPISVRVVQPNIEQTIKFERNEILRATDFALNSAIQSPAQLTIFPETMMPYPWNQAPELGLNALQNALNTQNNRAVLIGSVGVDSRHFYNSGIWLDGSGDVLNPQRYDKIHLLPFGEMVPWGFQWFVDAMNIPLGGYGYGQSRTPFELKTASGAVRIGANVCYENVFGEEMAVWHPDDARAPTVWVNLTNLGWFGDARTSAAHEQFLAMSRARAMELARPMLTATNTGVSAQIAPDGAVVQRLPAQVQAIGDWQVQPHQGLSLYAAWGNLPVFVLLGLFAAWVFWTKVKK